MNRMNIMGGEKVMYTHACVFLSMSHIKKYLDGECVLTVSVTEASSRITEYTRPLLLIVTYKQETIKVYVLLIQFMIN